MVESRGGFGETPTDLWEFTLVEHDQQTRLSYLNKEEKNISYESELPRPWASMRKRTTSAVTDDDEFSSDLGSHAIR